MAASNKISRGLHVANRWLKRPSSWNELVTHPSINSLNFDGRRLSNDKSSSSTYGWSAISCTRHYSTIHTCSSSSLTSLHHYSSCKQSHVTRNISIPTLNCPEYTPTIFGLTPILLTTFHSLGLPYWSGIALTNILIRTSMIPLVIQGAKTSVGIGVVAPEVQYLITNFRNDFGGLRKKEERLGGNAELRKAQYALVRYTVESLRGIFKLHKVNLLDIFKSPMLQIPIFWYFALDLRLIINGSDPILAQALVDSSFLHITDLTEPDPFYALPIATGALLYFNVETAVGKRALSGETSSQSRLAVIMKDFFQSLAIFMPCFMVQQPSGVQIYLMTSMFFSLCQSMAMRNDGVREAVGLPPMYSKPKGMEEGKYVKEFMEMMKERQEAKARGEFILGEGVLKLGGMPPRVGRKKKSSIEVAPSEEDLMKSSGAKVVEIELPMYTFTFSSLLVNPELFATRPTPIQMPAPSQNASVPSSYNASDSTIRAMPEIPLSVMEAANRGEKPIEIEMAPKELIEQNKKVDGPIDMNKLKMKRKPKGKPGKKGR